MTKDRVSNRNDFFGKLLLFFYFLCQFYKSVNSLLTGKSKSVLKI